MSLYTDNYIREYRSGKFRVYDHQEIIEVSGDLESSIHIGEHALELMGEHIDLNDYKMQRLKLRINQAILSDAVHWSSSEIVEEVSSILSIAFNRIVKPTGIHVLNIEGNDKIMDHRMRSFPHHPNLTAPINIKDADQCIADYIKLIKCIRTQDEYDRYIDLKRAITLYRDALILLPHDVDTAYLLLVMACETLGSSFSNVEPTIEDFPDYAQIQELVNIHGLDSSFLDQLGAILLKPKHLKVQQRFISVIESNLPGSFFQEPAEMYVLTIKGIDVETDVLEDPKWVPNKAPWTLRKEDLRHVLRNIYQCRSSYVHSGVGWPSHTKLRHNAMDVLRPILTDREGQPVKNKDGSYKLEPAIPSFFWFERVTNQVIRNIITNFC